MTCFVASWDSEVNLIKGDYLLKGYSREARHTVSAVAGGRVAVAAPETVRLEGRQVYKNVEGTCVLRLHRWYVTNVCVLSLGPPWSSGVNGV